MDIAREHYLEALEHAPRHPELVRRIAEIDAAFASRTEGARAMLLDAAPPDDPAAMLLVGQLSARSGDVGGALSWLARAADRDPVPSMIAYALGESARLTRDPFAGAAQLARAVALAPGSTSLRWQNFRLLLRTARLDEARAEAEQLETLTRGPNARASLWRTVAEAFRTEGHVSLARQLLERALRYRPDDPSTLLDVGAAFLDQGDTRALALLRRASELGTQDRGITARIELLFARAMASLGSDAPAALSRLREAPAGTEHEPEIRLCEARFRHELADPQGATVSYAAMRDALLARAAAAPRASADWLLEAARFERDVRGDLYAARQHALVAARIAKDDPAVARLLQQVSQAVALASREDGFVEATTAVDGAPALPAEAAKGEPTRTLIASVTIDDEDAASARVEKLADQLRADPTREDVVIELAGLLRALGRSHELLAVLLARVEDAPVEKREAVARGTRALLEELESEARAAGKEVDASLFRDALEVIAT
jgi:tetratricopeptide (TPR) repeat protein